MSESVAARHWEGLRKQVDEVTANLHALAVPPGFAGRAACSPGTWALEGATPGLGE